MREISLNILDIVENSTRAGAKRVSIFVEDDPQRDTLTIRVTDDGCGMTPEEVSKAFDPFFTTRDTRRVGLGLPILKGAAEATGGTATVESEPGRGTVVTAVFRIDHIDCPPLGDITSTLRTLIIGSPEVEFLYEHHVGRERVVLDTEALGREHGPGFRGDIQGISRVLAGLEILLVHLDEIGMANSEHSAPELRTGDEEI